MKHLEKQRARELRGQGYSIRDICRELAVAKSSVSLWVRDIQLTEEQVERLNQQLLAAQARFSYLSRCGGVNTNKADAEKRHKSAEQAGYEWARTDEKFRLICALYWGEGSKRGAHTFGVSNSDPKLLRIVLEWLVSRGFEEAIAFRVQYYAENGLSEDDIKRWWNEQIPGLKEVHWRKFLVCKINRASQRKKIGSLPYGTALIQVFRTELFFQVMGGIKYLQDMGDW